MQSGNLMLGPLVCSQADSSSIAPSLFLRVAAMTLMRCIAAPDCNLADTILQTEQACC